MNKAPVEKRSRKAKARRFYIVGPDARISGKGGWEMENLPALLMGRRVLVPPPGARRQSRIYRLRSSMTDLATGAGCLAMRNHSR
jgi:hypothetical protein